MMRILPVFVLSALALSTVGCVEDPGSASAWRRRNVPMQDEAEITAGPATETASSAIVVNGKVDPEAEKVDILAMDDKGELTPVGTAKVEDGKFQMQVSPDMSPTGVFVMKALGVGNKVINSGLLNGIPAFFKGFVIDIPMDTLTTYKAEVLQTIAKKGVPGAQNFINVLNAYVDGNVMGVGVVDGVLTNDVIELIGATADAVIAAEEVIEDSLRKVGLPVDFTALQEVQAKTVTGLQTALQNGASERLTAAQTLVAGFQKMLAGAAAPIDDAIFNAVVNGGGAYGSKMRVRPESSFAASKAAFAVTSELSNEQMTAAFEGTALEGKVKTSIQTFNASIGKASSPAQLEAAKTALLDGLLGRDAKAMFAPLDAFVKQLTTAVTTFDPAQVLAMLGEIDACDLQLPSKLRNAAGGGADLEAITHAFRLVQKQQVAK